MSLFRSSAESAANVYDKIMLYGPEFVGKTHTAMGWPSPVLVDVETRGAHFGDRFTFAHAEPTTIEEVADAFKEIRAGGISCETVIVDSYSAIYEKLIVLHTKKSNTGNYVTDYVTVNKRIAACRDFAFGLPRKNIIFIAHSIEKFDRKGDTFTNKGVDILGQHSFRYAFDYIFRLEKTGNDPRTSPPKFVVEKSASANLKHGQVIVGLDYAKFRALTRPQEKPSPPKPAQDHVAPAAAPRAGSIEDAISERFADISPPLNRSIRAIAAAKRITADGLLGKIDEIVQGAQLTEEEAARLVDSLKLVQVA